MAKKKNQSNENNKENDGNVTVVLGIDLHCEGCVAKIVKAIRSLDGVESVKKGDNELKKIKVVGKVDPVELREKVEEKLKKKVELISPATKIANDGGGEGQKKQQKEQTVAVKDENKPKKFPVTTTVLKIPLHCRGCIQKIEKLVSKTKGFIDMSFDESKDLVTVKGGIDTDELTAMLKEKMKRKVEIVPPKDGGGGGNGKKEKGGGGGDRKESGGGGRKMEGHRMEYYYAGQGQYVYPQYVNGPEYRFNYMHATQMFNDENPNACAVM